MATIKQLMDGMTIFVKHYDPRDHNVAAEHDVIYVETSLKSEKETPKDERKALDDLGWHWDTHASCLARFI